MAVRETKYNGYIIHKNSRVGFWAVFKGMRRVETGLPSKDAAKYCIDRLVAHESNEWADAATNGIVWLRNIRDGISTPAEALAEMESNVRRIRAEFYGVQS